MSSSVLPTRCEIICGGCSMIIAQIFAIAAYTLHSIDFDFYNVTNEEKVKLLHDQLSSNEHRTEIEIGVTCLWISYPFSIIAIYVLMKLFKPFFNPTPCAMVLYVAEKSYLVFVCVICIIFPALSLSTVSYDWSFHETVTESTDVPSGYYIQLYTVILQMELIDCLGLADGLFLCSVFLLSLYISFGSYSTSTFESFREIFEPKMFYRIAYCAQCIASTCFLTMLIAAAFVLFRFAETGFMSLTGYAGWCAIFSFIGKIYIGIRLLTISDSAKYEKIKNALQKDRNNNNHNI